MSQNRHLPSAASIAASLLALGLGLSMVPASAVDVAAGKGEAERSSDRPLDPLAQGKDATPSTLSGRSLHQVKRDLVEFRSSAGTTAPIEQSGRSLEQVKRELVLSRAAEASAATVPLSSISLYEAKRRLYLYGDVRDTRQH